MRGYPKHLNTRADYEYVRTHFPKEMWKEDFEESNYDEPSDGALGLAILVFFGIAFTLAYFF